MARNKKLKISGIGVPNFLIWLTGFYHAKKGIVEYTDDNAVIRSPYLCSCRNRFIEYKERVFSETEAVLESISRERVLLESKIEIEEEKYNTYCRKLELLQSPTSGNEYRAKIQLEAMKDEQSLLVLEIKARICELSEREKNTKSATLHLLEANLSKLKAKAYVYISGIQSASSINGVYLELNDSVSESFQNLLPANA